MSLFGFHLAVLKFFQLGTTVLLIGAYAFFSALREQRANHQADCETLLLCSVVVPELERFSDVASITAASEADLKNQSDKLFYFDDHLKRFMGEGRVPSESLAPEAKAVEHLLWSAASPISMLIVFCVMVYDMRRNDAYRIEHTHIRRDVMSKLILMSAANAVYTMLGVELAPAGFHKLGDTVAAMAVLGLLAGAGSMLVCVVTQTRWKSFWSESLVEVMGQASKAGDHDLFNRAQLLKMNVEAQPDVPLPGGTGLYVTIYSSVQIFILWIFNSLHR